MERLVLAVLAVLAVPAGMEPSEDRFIPSSTVSLLLPLDANGETLSALAAFIESGAVRPLVVRTDTLEDIRNDQADTEPLEPAALLEVQGLRVRPRCASGTT